MGFSTVKPHLFSLLSSHFPQSLSNIISFLCSEVLNTGYLHQLYFGESVITHHLSELDQLSPSH